MIPGVTQWLTVTSVTRRVLLLGWSLHHTCSTVRYPISITFNNIQCILSICLIETVLCICQRASLFSTWKNCRKISAAITLAWHNLSASAGFDLVSFPRRRSIIQILLWSSSCRVSLCFMFVMTSCMFWDVTLSCHVSRVTDVTRAQWH